MFRLHGCVKKPFGVDSDMKILKRKCIQKCRDAERKLAQLQLTRNVEMAHSGKKIGNT